MLFLHCLITLYDFSFLACWYSVWHRFLKTIEVVLHSWHKSHLVMVKSLFMYCWILFDNILLRIFTSVSMRGIDLWFSFYYLVFSITVILVPWNELGSIPSHSVFWKALCRMGINSSDVLQNSPVKPLGSGHFFFLTKLGVLKLWIELPKWL